MDCKHAPRGISSIAARKCCWAYYPSGFWGPTSWGAPMLANLRGTAWRGHARSSLGDRPFRIAACRSRPPSRPRLGGGLGARFSLIFAASGSPCHGHGRCAEAMAEQGHGRVDFLEVHLGERAMEELDVVQGPGTRPSNGLFPRTTLTCSASKVETARFGTDQEGSLARTQLPYPIPPRMARETAPSVSPRPRGPAAMASIAVALPRIPPAQLLLPQEGGARRRCWQPPPHHGPVTSRLSLSRIPSTVADEDYSLCPKGRDERASAMVSALSIDDPHASSGTTSPKETGRDPPPSKAAFTGEGRGGHAFRPVAWVDISGMRRGRSPSGPARGRPRGAVGAPRRPRLPRLGSCSAPSAFAGGNGQVRIASRRGVPSPAPCRTTTVVVPVSATSRANRARTFGSIVRPLAFA